MHDNEGLAEFTAQPIGQALASQAEVIFVN